MNVTVRSAVQADNLRIRPLQSEIAKLHFEGRPDLFRPEPRFYTEDEFARMLADPKRFIFVAQEEGIVVGYAFASVVHMRSHPTYVDFDVFHIDDICVLERCRGKGIGKMLFSVCKEEALRAHCMLMDLGVLSFNQDAISFYKSCGMTEQQRRMELILR